MNLRQLLSICQIVDHDLRISDAAEATFRSQPSVTRQIKELESELGFDIFIRSRNKVLSLTPQGEGLVVIARRMLHDVDNIHRMRKEITTSTQGDFIIATTHTHARYVLPPVVQRFMLKFPMVKLSLRQGNPRQCCELVARGHADIAICSTRGAIHEDVAYIACYKLRRSVVTPRRHPLLRENPLTLEALARYPLITYDEAYDGRQVINTAFSEKGLKPSIVLSAMDADVSKVYVRLGLGIAIIATLAFDPKLDRHLRRIDAGNLFKASAINLVVRRHSYLRGYAYEFMNLFAPKLSKAVIEEALFRKTPSSTPLDQLPEL